MLKVIYHSGLQGRLRNIAPCVRQGTQSRAPLLRVLSHLRGSNRRSHSLYGRAFFCSDSSDASEAEAGAEGKLEEGGADGAESKASSAILATNPRAEDYLTVRFLKFSLSRRRLVYAETAEKGDKKTLKRRGKGKTVNVPMLDDEHLKSNISEFGSFSFNSHFRRINHRNCIAFFCGWLKQLMVEFNFLLSAGGL